MDVLLREARSQARAVPAFECWDGASVRAIVMAAQRAASPVILQAGPPECECGGGPAALRALADLYLKDTEVEAALHLDHGKTLEHVRECLEAGFTSVMLDASLLPYEENVRLSREAAAMAHDFDASCEAELGRVAGAEAGAEVSEDESTQTDPGEAAAFVEDTGIDCLAVAIGTKHGVYHGEPRINLERLRRIADRVSAPLVLHGGSGTPPDILRECVRIGVSKVNICTEYSQAWIDGVTRSAATLTPSVPGIFYASAQAVAVELLLEKIKLIHG